MPVANIVRPLESGLMKDQGALLTVEEKLSVAGSSGEPCVRSVRPLADLRNSFSRHHHQPQ